LGVTTGLLIAGATLVVAAVFLLVGLAWALLAAGLLVIAYALLLHNVDTPAGDVSRAGR
jgi:predicted acyltransferase